VVCKLRARITHATATDATRTATFAHHAAAYAGQRASHGWSDHGFTVMTSQPYRTNVAQATIPGTQRRRKQPAIVSANSVKTSGENDSATRR
jgi:hypothetical protein